MSARLSICGTLSPHPAICFFPSPGAPLLPAGGALAASGGSEATPSPVGVSSWQRGTWPCLGMPRVSRMGAKGAPGKAGLEEGWIRETGKVSRGPLWPGPHLPVDFSPSTQQGHLYPRFYPGGRCAWWPSAPGFLWLLNSSYFLRIASLRSDLC